MHQPYHIVPVSSKEGLLYLAGLYETSADDGASYFVVTTSTSGTCTYMDADMHKKVPEESQGQESDLKSMTLARLHDRMPVILTESERQLWLDPDTAWNAELEQILTCKSSHVKCICLTTNEPVHGEDKKTKDGDDEDIVLGMYPVSTYVSNVRHDGAECIQVVDPGAVQQKKASDSKEDAGKGHRKITEFFSPSKKARQCQ
jgi:putative SOS response-associated peptidase YedK